VNKRLAVALAIVLLGVAPSGGAIESAPLLGAIGVREQLLEAFERMPEARLKVVFLRCARDSSQRMLGLDEAMPCAMAWDALLRRGFGGNVDSLLAWWRFHREANIIELR
jgi:hypothetical protein